MLNPDRSYELLQLYGDNIRLDGDVFLGGSLTFDYRPAGAAPGDTLTTSLQEFAEQVSREIANLKEEVRRLRENN
jgi:hypothetical protein